MIFVLIPHNTKAGESFRIFTSYSAVEQAALVAARDFERYGLDPNWCYIISYDGQDELYATFIYTLVGSTRLQREKVPIPAS